MVQQKINDLYLKCLLNYFIKDVFLWVLVWCFGYELGFGCVGFFLCMFFLMVGWENGFVSFCCLGGVVWCVCFGFVLFYIPELFCSSKCISLEANTIGVSPLHFWLMLAEDLHDYTQLELNHKLLHLRRSFPCRSPSVLASAV